MAEAKRDGNFVPTLLAVSNADGTTPIVVYADPTTHRLLVDVAGASGVSVEVPTGTVDGSNLTFTFTNEPSAISVDGLLRRATKGYTISGSGPYTVTVDALTPPVYDVFSIY